MNVLDNWRCKKGTKIMGDLAKICISNPPKR